MRRSTARLVAGWLAAAALLPVAAQADDDANRRRYAREALVSEAKSVVPASGEETNLEPLVDALENDRKLLAAWQAAGSAGRADVSETLRRFAEHVDRRAALLPGSAAPGALAMSRRLYRWVIGLEDCPVVVRGRDGRPPRSYPLRPAAPADATKPSSPDEPPDPWASLVRAVLDSEGTLLTKVVEASPTPCLDLGPLAALAARSPRGRLLYEGLGADPDVNEPWLRLRAVQAKERAEAYAKESPTPGLVDESTVREKTRRAAEHREEAEGLERARDAQVARLDALVAEGKAVRKQLGDLAGRIDVSKRAADRSGAPAPATPTAPEASPALSVPELGVRELEAEEALASLELRLLLWAALRADARARLHEGAAQLARTEALAAELAASRFTDELQRVRRERQLDRLDYEAGELAASLEEARRPPGPGAAVRAEDAAWNLAVADVYQALLAVNGVVRDAVKLRRLTARSDASTGDRPSPGVAPTATTARDDLVVYRDPEAAGLDLAYVDGALRQLPRFDTELVTRNHAAAVRRIAALRVRLRATEDRAAVTARFEAAAADAEARIGTAEAAAPARALWRIRGFRAALKQARADHADAVAGIDAEKARLTAQLAALTRLRDALLDQGPRSFGIRVDPEVNPEVFAEDAEHAGTHVEAAWHWLTFRGDEHVGTFARAHAWALAGLASAALLCFVGVRRLRRWITARLDRVVLDPAEPVAGASVEEEREAVAEKKVQETAAMKAAEAAALHEVSGAPAGPEDPPPPAAGGGA
ncbi:MAG: hypothetical protein JNM10_19775 [Planctomycetia bacterium]|nr:hypothetical protein [Planctomycetia bacterium]